MLKSLKDAAAEIGVPYRTVYNRYLRGDIPAQKVGRTIAIEPEYLRTVVAHLGITPRPTRKPEKEEE